MRHANQNEQGAAAARVDRQKFRDSLWARINSDSEIVARMISYEAPRVASVYLYLGLLNALTHEKHSPNAR